MRARPYGASGSLGVPSKSVGGISCPLRGTQGSLVLCWVSLWQKDHGSAISSVPRARSYQSAEAQGL